MPPGPNDVERDADQVDARRTAGRTRPAGPTPAERAGDREPGRRAPADGRERDALGLQRAVRLRRVEGGARAAEFSSVANPVVPGKNTPMPPTTLAVLDDRDAAGQRGDAAALGRRAAARTRTRRSPAANSSCPAGTNAGSMLNRCGQRHVVGRALDAVGAGVERAVAVGVLDLEQVHLRRVGDVRREVALDADRGDEPGPAERRVRVGDVRVRVRPRAR